MEELAKLLGGEHKVRLLRLFLNYPQTPFQPADISKRIRVPLNKIRRELSLLTSIKFITLRETKVIKPGKGKKRSKRVKRTVSYTLNTKFPLNGPLRSLLFGDELFRKDEIVNWFKNAGKLKLVVVAGIFTGEPQSRVDILLVGDRLNRPSIESALRGMEAEIGKELSYAVLETKEFNYRLGIYDKFVRDVLDFPHEKVLDKLGLEESQ